MAEHENPLATTSSVRLKHYETRSTAVVEYMAKQVRLPPGPLGEQMGPDPVGDDESPAGKALPNTSSSA